jgi:hypothetical protein
MANKWLAHVKKTMRTMKSKGSYKKGDGLKKVILEAKKTYKKLGRRGGGDEEPEPEEDPAMPGGGKRRRTRRRRHH